MSFPACFEIILQWILSLKEGKETYIWAALKVMCFFTITEKIVVHSFVESHGVREYRPPKWCNEGAIVIRNSNWTEWSTIPGAPVIVWIILKLAEHATWVWFEIKSTITSWIVQHKVQLLINHINNKLISRLQSFLIHFCVKKLKLYLVSLTNSGKTARKTPSDGFLTSQSACRVPSIL